MPTALYRRLSVLFSVCVVVLLTGVAQPRAAEFDSYKELGVFRDWIAYEGQAQGKKICFIESRPQKMDRRLANRQLSAVRATVVNRPGDRVKGEVVIQTGFPIASDVFADIDIDNNAYKMATDPSGILWLPSRNEAAFVSAMRRGISMVTKVKSGSTVVSDTYSLRGFTAALRAIDAACG
ncbi:MAG: hypothetical protein RIC87_00670 [Kiloniellales bacterium]